MTLTLSDIVAMGDQLKADLGYNDYVIVALGGHGPNLDMPEGNVLATVRMGDDEATAEAKYLADAVALARGSIVRKREAAEAERARKAAKQTIQKEAGQ